MRVGLLKVQARWDLLMLERQRHLDQSSDAGRGLRVADVGLDRAQGAGAPGETVEGKHCTQGFRFDRIAQEGAGAVRLDVLNVAR